jgi:hypothetical protein
MAARRQYIAFPCQWKYIALRSNISPSKSCPEINADFRAALRFIILSSSHGAPF